MIDSRSQTVDATGQIRLANANFVFILATTAALSLTLSRDGSTESFTNLLAGLKVARLRKWDFAFFTAAAGTVVSFLYGITAVREDNTDVLQALATISGNVSTTDLPSTTLSTPDDNALAAATTENIAANLARRRITLGCLSTNTVGFRVQAVGANDTSGIEVQPGTFVELRTTASIDVRNNDGAVATSYYILEEA